MGVLIKNEFYKLKREWFMVFLLLLSLLPILTAEQEQFLTTAQNHLLTCSSFMNNQFSMFFPMVIFILIGSLFYQEYKNKNLHQLDYLRFFQRRSSFYRKSLSASLSASASRPSYLSLLACLWRYSTELAG